MPTQAQASATQNTAMMVDGDRAAERRRRRLDDLQRRRQEGELFPAATTAARNEAATTFLSDFMDPRLQAVERGVASAGVDQLVVGAILDDAAVLDGDDAIGYGAPWRGGAQ